MDNYRRFHPVCFIFIGRYYYGFQLDNIFFYFEIKFAGFSLPENDLFFCRSITYPVYPDGIGTDRQVFQKIVTGFVGCRSKCSTLQTDSEEGNVFSGIFIDDMACEVGIGFSFFICKMICYRMMN